ncbi:hypothetical protein [Caulobacter sp. NIBR2454]|nr:hypothetical protein [Caulobacter sp. NIBR2454]
MGLSVVFAGTVWVLVTMFTAPPPASERERLAAEAARTEVASYVSTGQ